MSEESAQIKDAGCDMHLAKPISKARLLDVLRMVVKGRVAAAATGGGDMDGDNDDDQIESDNASEPSVVEPEILDAGTLENLSRDIGGDLTCDEPEGM